MGLIHGGAVTEIGDLSNTVTGWQKDPSNTEKTKRDALIIEYLPIVDYVVQSMLRKLPSFVDKDDLTGAGVLGLIGAAERFDSKRAVRFRTYAEVRVRGAVLDYLRSLSWAPRGVHRKVREIDRARSAVELRVGRFATLSEVAAEMGISSRELSSVLRETQRLQFCSLEEIAEEPISSRTSEQKGDPFVHIERKELVDVVSGVLEKLPERQKLLLWLYYYEQLTMKEVGMVLGVNEARTSQLHSKAISALKSGVMRKLGVGPAGTARIPGSERRQKPRGRSARRSRQPAADNPPEDREI